MQVIFVDSITINSFKLIKYMAFKFINFFFFVCFPSYSSNFALTTLWQDFKFHERILLVTDSEGKLVYSYLTYFSLIFFLIAAEKQSKAKQKSIYTSMRKQQQQNLSKHCAFSPAFSTALTITFVME